jgi:hypothetical protein
MLGKYYCRIMIGRYERPSPFRNSTWAPHTAFHLPLPDGLNDETSVKYSGTDLETVGDVINGNIGSGLLSLGIRNAGGALSSGLSRAAGAAAGALASIRGNSELGNTIQEAVSQGVANAFPANQIQSAFEQTIGMAPNPNPSVAFQGPNLREFTLAWTFFPTNKIESENVFNIIKTLKRSSLPNNTVDNSAAILSYPDMVQLNFFPWDTGGSGNPWGWNTENSIIRIKKCVMGSVNVDYNPSNVPGFFADTNAPVAIKLSIGFSEIEYLLSDDWGHNANRQSESLVGAFATMVSKVADAFNPIKIFEDTTT